MLHPMSEKAAKVAGVKLEEYVPKIGEQFGMWWTIIWVGQGPNVHFYGNKAIPSGTIVKMLNGPTFQLDDLVLRPIAPIEEA